MVLSLPTRERGLKFLLRFFDFRAGYVAPYAGAWIEIVCSNLLCLLPRVAPYAGAWIEIRKKKCLPWEYRSLPTRERGLKYPHRLSAIYNLRVAPYAGAWIEMSE